MVTRKLTTIIWDSININLIRHRKGKQENTRKKIRIGVEEDKIRKGRYHGVKTDKRFI